MLADEVLTPDSSRFWPAADYAAGKNQDSYDKQVCFTASLYGCIFRAIAASYASRCKVECYALYWHPRMFFTCTIEALLCRVV